MILMGSFSAPRNDRFAFAGHPGKSHDDQCLPFRKHVMIWPHGQEKGRRDARPPRASDVGAWMLSCNPGSSDIMAARRDGNAPETWKVRETCPHSGFDAERPASPALGGRWRR